MNLKKALQQCYQHSLRETMSLLTGKCVKEETTCSKLQQATALV
jgi:hypothetical protein